MASGIYRIVLIQDGRCYIGSSYDMQKRWGQHKTLLNKGKHTSHYMQRCWNKYGPEAFACEELEECERDKMVLLPREQAWMDLLLPVFNLSPVAGSNLGYKHTDEARANMSAAQQRRPPVSEETKLKLREANLGKSPSAETRAKISAAHTGRKHTPESLEKMSTVQAERMSSPEERQRVSDALMGHEVPEETRTKISETLKGRQPPEHVVNARRAGWQRFAQEKWGREPDFPC